MMSCFSLAGRGKCCSSERLCEGISSHWEKLAVIPETIGQGLVSPVLERIGKK